MARRLQIPVAISLVVFVAGIARDLVWHATHDTQKEFETASTQVAVHWLLWVGAVGLLVTSTLALRGSGNGRRRGYGLIFVASVVYAAVSVWHFIEHANGTDPQVAHVFLYVTSAALLAGGAFVLGTRAGAPRRPQQSPAD
jgi:hypothetical protein